MAARRRRRLWRRLEPGGNAAGGVATQRRRPRSRAKAVRLAGDAPRIDERAPFATASSPSTTPSSPQTCSTRRCCSTSPTSPKRKPSARCGARELGARRALLPPHGAGASRGRCSRPSASALALPALFLNAPLPPSPDVAAAAGEIRGVADARPRARVVARPRQLPERRGTRGAAVGVRPDALGRARAQDGGRPHVALRPRPRRRRRLEDGGPRRRARPAARVSAKCRWSRPRSLPTGARRRARHRAAARARPAGDDGVATDADVGRRRRGRRRLGAAVACSPEQQLAQRFRSAAGAAHAATQKVAALGEQQEEVKAWFSSTSRCARPAPARRPVTSASCRASSRTAPRGGSR